MPKQCLITSWQPIKSLVQAGFLEAQLIFMYLMATIKTCCVLCVLWTGMDNDQQAEERKNVLTPATHSHAHTCSQISKINLCVRRQTMWTIRETNPVVWTTWKGLRLISSTTHKWSIHPNAKSPRTVEKKAQMGGNFEIHKLYNIYEVLSTTEVGRHYDHRHGE